MRRAALVLDGAPCGAPDDEATMAVRLERLDPP